MKLIPAILKQMSIAYRNGGEPDTVIMPTNNIARATRELVEIDPDYYKPDITLRRLQNGDEVKAFGLQFKVSDILPDDQLYLIDTKAITPGVDGSLQWDNRGENQ